MEFLILRAFTIALEFGLAEILEDVNQTLRNIFNLSQFSPRGYLGRAQHVFMVQHFGNITL